MPDGLEGLEVGDQRLRIRVGELAVAVVGITETSMRPSGRSPVRTALTMSAALQAPRPVSRSAPLVRLLCEAEPKETRPNLNLLASEFHVLPRQPVHSRWYRRYRWYSKGSGLIRVVPSEGIEGTGTTADRDRSHRPRT